MNREQLKKVYKKNRKEDAEVGKKINLLVQEIHVINKSEEMDVETKKVQLEKVSKSLSELKSQSRFKNEFPKFANFKNYVVKNKLKAEDLI